MRGKNEVLPRFELGSLDSKSKVLTITPQDRRWGGEHYLLSINHSTHTHLFESLMVVAYVDSVMSRSGWHWSIQADLRNTIYLDIHTGASTVSQHHNTPQMSIWCHVVVSLLADVTLDIRQSTIGAGMTDWRTVYTTDWSPTLIWNMAAPRTCPA